MLGNSLEVLKFNWLFFSNSIGSSAMAKLQWMAAMDKFSSSAIAWDTWDIHYFGSYLVQVFGLCMVITYNLQEAPHFIHLPQTCIDNQSDVISNPFYDGA